MSSVVRDKINDLRDLIQDWIEIATDYEFIEDDQYIPGPTNKAYFTYSLPSNITKVGDKDSLIFDKANDVFILSGQREVTVSIKSRGLPYKKNQSELLRGTDMLAELEWTIDRPDVVALFQREEFTIVSHEPILETSDVEDNVLMPRGAFDLRLRFSLREEVSVDYIDTIKLSGRLDAKLDGSFSTAVGPFTITIP